MFGIPWFIMYCGTSISYIYFGFRMMLVEIELQLQGKSPDMIVKKVRRLFRCAKLSLFLFLLAVLAFAFLNFEDEV